MKQNLNNKNAELFISRFLKKISDKKIIDFLADKDPEKLAKVFKIIYDAFPPPPQENESDFESILKSLNDSVN